MTTNAPPGVIGNLVELAAWEVLLPSFVERRQDGVWLDISPLDSPGLFHKFVSSVFSAGAYLIGLDYGVFQRLLFESSPADIDAMLQSLEANGRGTHLRLAQEIAPFTDQRRAIYRGLKVIDNGAAVEYFFEQVVIEQADQDGDAENSGSLHTRAERAFLDIDEFIAALWLKGVCFGIDIDLVQNTIATDKVERLIVAQQKLPQEGSDASVSAQTDSIHRNDRPRMRQDGRIDLCQFINRFPQVAAGQQLFKKVPRQPGISGFNVFGRELSPPVVKDFDLAKMAGPGTQVEKIAGDGDYIVATDTGFLSIDSQSGVLSVSDKIINRDGVSVRTTGNLDLSGDNYEEHGEVQEKRTVKGRNMTFCADVYGEVESDSGRIEFKKNLAGGTARSPRGAIVVAGKASRAIIDASGGDVDVATAENCTIIARRIRLGRATLCDIVADEVHIEHSEGCAIATKAATLANSGARRNDATRLILRLPDTAFHTREIANEKEAMERDQQIEIHLRKKVTELLGGKDFKTYLGVQPKIRSGEMTLTPVQEANWQKLVSRIAPQLAEQKRLMGELRRLSEQAAARQTRIDTLLAERDVMVAETRGNIVQITGETLVRSRLPGELPLIGLGSRELKIRLRETAAGDTLLFSGSQGSFIWPASCF